MATFLPANAVRDPILFPDLDTLAAHLMRIRPGRHLVLLPGAAHRETGPEFPVLSIYAARPGQAQALAADPAAFEPDWLGLSADDGAGDIDQVQAALARIRTAGGLAA